MSKVELKPCPFCGRKATHEIFNDLFFTYCRVTCKCGVMLTVPCQTGNEGMIAWNRRTDDEQRETNERKAD